MGCNLCPLALADQVEGCGPQAPKLIVVGDYPTTEDEASGIPFSGGANTKRDYPNLIIRRALTSLGLDHVEEVAYAYALRCNPWHRKEDIKIKPAFRTTCRSRHLEPEIAAWDCDTILVMGEEALKSLMPDLSGSLHMHRGRWHEAFIGGRRRHLRVTYSCQFIQKMSMFHAVEVKGGKIISGERWNPPGSCGDLFRKDLIAVRNRLKEQYGNENSTAA